MVNEKVLSLLNKQILEEFRSAYIYLGIETYFNDTGLKGMANWFRVQSQEELDHAVKILNYVQEIGGHVELPTIKEVSSNYPSPLAALESALKHEQHITNLIYKIMDAAIEERDHKTKSFLQWFVDEQVEEEANVGDQVNRLRLVKDSPEALFYLDNELGQRVYTPPKPL